jgi:hypothetical protein
VKLLERKTRLLLMVLPIDRSAQIEPAISEVVLRGNVVN